MTPESKHLMLLVGILSAFSAMLGAAQGKLTLSVDTTDGLKTARILEGVQRPKLVLEVLPVYPFNLPALAEGSVTVRMTIGKDGVVKDAKIVTHAMSFDASALASVRQSRFEPVLINGAATEVVVNRTITFPKNRGPITVSDRPAVIEVPSRS